MLKYASQLTSEEINYILTNCNLKAVAFNNSPAITRSKSAIFVTCVKMDSLVYKNVLEWSDKRNSNGDLLVTYIEKEDYNEFVVLSITDFFVRIINKSNIQSNFEIKSINNLTIKLNAFFLSIMLNKFNDANYKKKLELFNISKSYDKNIKRI